MRIERFVPPPPLRQVMMVFPAGEGWAIIAALRAYAVQHPDAVDRGHWLRWASELDAELKS